MHRIPRRATRALLTGPRRYNSGARSLDDFSDWLLETARRFNTAGLRELQQKLKRLESTYTRVSHAQPRQRPHCLRSC